MIKLYFSKTGTIHKFNHIIETVVDLKLLSPEFRAKALMLLDNCIKRGVLMWPTEGLRNPLVQAQYWRRSKTDEQVKMEIKKLKDAGAHFLRYCVEKAGPQIGPHATNALPGLSWHQWGEALDCAWRVNDKIVWDLNTRIDNINGYTIYAEEAKKIGLDCGFYWKSFIDASHVQLRPDDSPLSIYTLQEINDEMYLRYNNIL